MVRAPVRAGGREPSPGSRDQRAHLSAARPGSERRALQAENPWAVAPHEHAPGATLPGAHRGSPGRQRLRLAGQRHGNRRLLRWGRGLRREAERWGRGGPERSAGVAAGPGRPQTRRRGRRVSVAPTTKLCRSLAPPWGPHTARTASPVRPKPLKFSAVANLQNSSVHMGQGSPILPLTWETWRGVPHGAERRSPHLLQATPPCPAPWPGASQQPTQCGAGHARASGVSPAEPCALQHPACIAICKAAGSGSTRGL